MNYTRLYKYNQQTLFYTIASIYKVEFSSKQPGFQQGFFRRQMSEKHMQVFGVCVCVCVWRTCVCVCVWVLANAIPGMRCPPVMPGLPGIHLSRPHFNHQELLTPLDGWMNPLIVDCSWHIACINNHCEKNM